ncbi:hypothetical protein CASFOL_016045 [Castilleja foliolosa]|uniref:Uncharacterized protein n=1 Tax=Castilleja foliolosa TaxID=1961234 RepID=A0ABD3DHE0_9LAMI
MSRPNLDFDSLSEFHNSVNELLRSPNTKLQIINGGHKKWAHQVSEASLRMADSCAAAKDVLILAKCHLQNLQPAFRRITATETAGNTFAPHRLPRKQLKKAILKRLHSLKGMRSTYSAVLPPPENSLAVVVDLLKEVRATIYTNNCTVAGIADRDTEPGWEGETRPGS